MTVYAYTDHSTHPPELAFHLEREAIPSEEVCYIDHNSIACLGELIEGQLSSYRQVLDAETYLRALLFHKSIRPISPCVQVSHINNLNDRPFIYTHWKSVSSFKSIDYIFNHVQHHSHICTIADVVTFASIDLEKIIVTQQNARHAQHGHLLKEGSTLRIYTDLGRYVPICQSLNDYADDVFAKNDYLVSKFLKEIPLTGVPFYLSDKLYADKIDKIYNLNPLYPFLEKVDSEWDSIKNAIKYSISVPMPPFLYMILSRAGNRKDIPDAILSLRKDFEPERKLIWEFLDEIKYRSDADPILARRMLHEIDAKIEKVMGKFCGIGREKSVFLKYISTLSLLCDFSSGNLPLVSSLSKAIGNFVGEYGYYPLNGFKQQLETIDWHSFERHFSRQELDDLYRSLGRAGYGSGD